MCNTDFYILGTRCLGQIPVVQDNPPLSRSFGDVLTDVRATPYHAGETVATQFVGFAFNSCSCKLIIADDRHS